jgi:hypothetical protein
MAAMPASGTYRATDGGTRLNISVTDPATQAATIERRAPIVEAQTVDAAIEALDGAVHPLNEDQQAWYAEAAWNDLVKESLLMDGRPLTAAVKRVIESENSVVHQASRAVRRSVKHVNARVRPRDSDEEEEVPRRQSRKVSGSGSRDKREKRHAELVAMTACPSYVKSGACAEFKAGGCRDHRHFKSDVKKK